MLRRQPTNLSNATIVDQHAEQFYRYITPFDVHHFLANFYSYHRPTTSTSSNATAVANNTIINSNFTSQTKAGATNNTIYCCCIWVQCPTSAIVSQQQFPGPYGDEDILLGLQLQLLAYSQVRQAFYETRSSFHPATGTLVVESF